MKVRKVTGLLLVAGMAVSVTPALQAADKSATGAGASPQLPVYTTYRVVDGTITLNVSKSAIANTGGTVAGDMAYESGGEEYVSTSVGVLDSGASIYTSNGHFIGSNGSLETLGGFTFSDPNGEQVLEMGDFSIAFDRGAMHLMGTRDFARDVFEAPFDAMLDAGILTVSGTLQMGRSLADFLGMPSAALDEVGFFTAELVLDHDDSETVYDPSAGDQEPQLGFGSCNEGHEPGGPFPSCGFDVIVGDLQAGIQKWGSAGDIMAYSIGTTSCNKGEEILPWIQNSTLHPVIPQHMFRLKDGRFEQIGMSWLKHGFCALQDNICGFGCQPAGVGCPSALGPGCSDPYSPSRNGTQGLLGPRYQVNAFSGDYSFPFASPDPSVSGTIRQRIQVHEDDLNPALNSGALYWGEAIYVHKSDAESGNNLNNASHRPFTVGSLSGGAYNLFWSGATVREFPAITAWTPANDSIPGVIGPQVSIVNVPDEGRFYFGHKVTQLGPGDFAYEHAIYNYNSDRSARSLEITFDPLMEPGTNVMSDIGFKDIHYHSGDGPGVTNLDNTDWAVTVDPDTGITWETDTFDENPQANAVRWGTLYNYRYRSNLPPARGNGVMGLFKPGTPDSVNVSVFGPGLDCNDNDIADENETNPETDADGNRILDECQEFVIVPSAIGSRYAEVSLAGATEDPVALLITGDGDDPAVSCVAKYLQPDGTLGDTAAFQTLSEWGSEMMFWGEDILPGKQYNVQVDSGSPGNPDLGPPLPPITTFQHGDVDGDETTNLADTLAIILGIEGAQPPEITMANMDISPCDGPDQIVNLADALETILVIEGETYGDLCPAVCP